MPDIDTGAAVGGTDTSTPVSGGTDASASGASSDWDGSDWSPETLDKHAWWKAIPEGARGHISKAHEERTTARQRADYLDRLFGSDDEPLRKEHEALTKEKAAWETEKTALAKERDDLKKALQDIETRAAEEAEDREYERLKGKYADIFADLHPDPEKEGELLPKGAYVKFVKLLSSGFDEEEAASMARAVMINKPAAQPTAEPEAPKPPKTRDVKPPPAIANASAGGANPAATVNAKEANEDFNQRARRLKKQYAAEESQ